MHLTLYQFTFFYSLKENAFKESRFQDIENIIKKATTKLNAGRLDAFDNCFMQLLEGCKKYFAVKGDYLEEK